MMMTLPESDFKSEKKTCLVLCFHEREEWQPNRISNRKRQISLVFFHEEGNRYPFVQRRFCLLLLAPQPATAAAQLVSSTTTTPTTPSPGMISVCRLLLFLLQVILYDTSFYDESKTVRRDLLLYFTNQKLWLSVFFSWLIRCKHKPPTTTATNNNLSPPSVPFHTIVTFRRMTCRMTRTATIENGHIR